MRYPLSLSLLLLGLTMAAPAQAVEVESGVTPEQRERIRVSLTMSSARHEALLLRTPTGALSRTEDGSVLLPFPEELCDLPCTVRVPRLGDRLTVRGEGWAVPIRMQRFRGSDLDLVVRPGRPGALLAGMLLTTFSLIAATSGSTLWLTGSAVGRADGEEGPSTLMLAGRGLTVGGLGAMPLAIGMIIRGSPGVRQRKRRR